jgi:molybdopterin synthase catalytic subunit
MLSAFAVIVRNVRRWPAFAACEENVSTVKAKLLIWKSELCADGIVEWVNNR